MSAHGSHRIHRKAYNEPGHAHELTFSCYRGFKFLHAERTCQWLCEALTESRVALDFDIWAYVFMPEHAHILVHPRQPEYDISTICEEIKEPVGRKGIGYLRKHAPEWLPRLRVQATKRARYRFWQKGGGYDRNVVEPRTLLKMIDYIHQNPVRRGLVERAAEWKWSSAAWYVNGTAILIPVDPIPPEWLRED